MTIARVMPRGVAIPRLLPANVIADELERFRTSLSATGIALLRQLLLRLAYVLAPPDLRMYFQECAPYVPFPIFSVREIH